MINNNIKFCRENLELTQRELGNIFGVTGSTVSGWETGKDIMPLDKLIKFCDLFNFSIDYVLGLQKANTSYENIVRLSKKEVGQKLRSIRKQLKLTQKQIAEECMISQTTYSNYELGINLITTLSLYTICKNHKLSMDKVLGRVLKNILVH